MAMAIMCNIPVAVIVAGGWDVPNFSSGSTNGTSSPPTPSNAFTSEGPSDQQDGNVDTTSGMSSLSKVLMVMWAAMFTAVLTYFCWVLFAGVNKYKRKLFTVAAVRRQLPRDPNSNNEKSGTSSTPSTSSRPRKDKTRSRKSSKPTSSTSRTQSSTGSGENSLYPDESMTHMHYSPALNSKSPRDSIVDLSRYANGSKGDAAAGENGQGGNVAKGKSSKKNKSLRKSGAKKARGLPLNGNGGGVKWPWVHGGVTSLSSLEPPTADDQIFVIEMADPVAASSSSNPAGQGGPSSRAATLERPSEGGSAIGPQWLPSSKTESNPPQPPRSLFPLPVSTMKQDADTATSSRHASEKGKRRDDGDADRKSIGSATSVHINTRVLPPSPSSPTPMIPAAIPNTAGTSGDVITPLGESSPCLSADEGDADANAKKPDDPQALKRLKPWFFKELAKGRTRERLRRIRLLWRIGVGSLLIAVMLCIAGTVWLSVSLFAASRTVTSLHPLFINLIPFLNFIVAALSLVLILASLSTWEFLGSVLSKTKMREARALVWDNNVNAYGIAVGDPSAPPAGEDKKGKGSKQVNASRSEETTKRDEEEGEGRRGGEIEESPESAAIRSPSLDYTEQDQSLTMASQDAVETPKEVSPSIDGAAGYSPMADAEVGVAPELVEDLSDGADLGVETEVDAYKDGEYGKSR
ncbi:hypothetical protein HK102_002452 [Quaeritorhiza haematococci]|nr:hypothetical protein HK102_002452 [Quaeritorhiza haematococci]